MLKNLVIVQRVFRNSEENNIRSLKCAIQDFDRVFSYINSYEFSNEEKSYFFGSFLVLVFELKAGKLKDDEYGFSIVDSELAKKYSDFNSRFVIEVCRRWLMTGEWLLENINNELQAYKDKLHSKKPEDSVIGYSLIDLDDEIFEEGFPSVIEKAYDGQLSMDGYISILTLRIEARHFVIKFPLEVDLSLLYQAIERRIEKIKEGSIEEPKGHSYITEDDFLEDEAKIYRLIKDFRKFEQHYKNRIIFIKAIESKNEKYIYDCFNKYYISFDEEMANKVFDYYKDLNNIGKRIFWSEFSRAWCNVPSLNEKDTNVTISGLTKLSSLV